MNFRNSTIFLLLVFIFYTVPLYSLPPQIVALNDYLSENAKQLKRQIVEDYYLDESGSVYILLRQILYDSYNPELKYISISGTGQITQDIIIPDSIFLKGSKFDIKSDKLGNLYSFYEIYRGFNQPNYAYFMIDNHGNLVRDVILKPNFYYYDGFTFLPNGSLLVSGFFMNSGKPRREMEQIFIIDPQSFESDYLTLESPDCNLLYISNLGADVYPLGDSVILFLKHDKGYFPPEFSIVRKAIYNFKSKELLSFECLNLEDIYSYKYPEMDTTIIIQNKSRKFIDLGDNIAYWFKWNEFVDLEKRATSTTLCVILIDKKDGEIMGGDYQIEGTVRYSNISEHDRRDNIIRLNSTIYGETSFDDTPRFGTISFRNFPEILVDKGPE
jgi:hypothetical protein